MKTLVEIINTISEEAKNKFKPDLKKYGKNFRAISESAVLEVLNPLFKEHNIAYEVIIQSKSLHIEKLKAEGIPFTEKNDINTNSLKAFLMDGLGLKGGVQKFTVEDIPPCIHFQEVSFAELSMPEGV